MPRGKNCRETIFATQLSRNYPHRGGNFGRRKKALSCGGEAILGERQSITQKGFRAIDARNSQLENGSNAAKTSVRAPGLSADEREHPFV